MNDIIYLQAGNRHQYFVGYNYVDNKTQLKLKRINSMVRSFDVIKLFEYLIILDPLCVHKSITLLLKKNLYSNFDKYQYLIFVSRVPW